ncbi:MAG: hypothetical protein JXR83_23575 [Deltaproteobacteria bacterium]|nr:hypothetical protein [Deltaproteobacteria bacterium]
MRRFAHRVAVAVLAVASGSACEILTAIGGGEGLPCQSDEACPTGTLCLDGVCARQVACNGDRDCPSGHCRNGVCVASGRDAAVDGSAADLAGRDLWRPDTAGTDQWPGDAARYDAVHSDTRPPDRWHSDTRQPDTRQPDTRLPDTRQPDTRLPDTRLPDTWRPDTSGTDRGPCASNPCGENYVCIPSGASYDCVCYGLECGTVCYDSGECCDSGDCGSGYWNCDQDHECVCPSPYLDCSDNCRLGTQYFLDYDSDGYGDGNTTIRACSRPSGYVTNSDDCDDDDGRAHPGQDEYFATAAAGGGFDFNCDGSETRESSDVYTCTSCTPNISATPLGDRECHRCSNTYAYCWVDFDVDPDPTCDGCCSTNAFYQLDCSCSGTPPQQHANCLVSSCIGIRVTAGWQGGVPACGVTGRWVTANSYNGVCVGGDLPCDALASVSFPPQACR